MSIDGIAADLGQAGLLSLHLFQANNLDELGITVGPESDAGVILSLSAHLCAAISKKQSFIVQDFFEKKFPPFAERYDLLCKRLGKTKEETADLLGLTTQGINKGIREGKTPIDRILLVELLLEKMETQFLSPGARIGRLVQEIVREEMKINAADAAAIQAADDAAGAAGQPARGGPRPLSPKFPPQQPSALALNDRSEKDKSGES